MLGSNFRAFRWVKGSDFEMLGLPGGNNSYEMAINDSGWMAGHTQTRGGYLRANNLGTLDHGLNSFAYGINNTGAVVGSSQAANGESHEFLYQDGVLYDLNLLMGDSSGWQLQWAYDINYEGQIVGENARNTDLDVNIVREKKLTNMRSSSADDAVRIIPPKVLNLEQAIEFIKDDEFVEVTPTSIRLRKKILKANQR